VNPQNNQIIRPNYETGYFGLSYCKDGNVQRAYRTDTSTGAYEWRTITQCTDNQVCINAACIDKQPNNPSNPTECTTDNRCPDGTIFAKCVSGNYVQAVDKCPTPQTPQPSQKVGCNTDEYNFGSDASPSCFGKTLTYTIGAIAIIFIIGIIGISIYLSKKKGRR
jgi:hypothetical protein